MTDEPQHPIRWANYPGITDPGFTAGPNAYGEGFHAITAVYDPVNDRTKIGFRFADINDPPPAARPTPSPLPDWLQAPQVTLT